MRNFLIDVAFSVEGPWETFEEIPMDVLVDGMERRWRELQTSDEIGAFGFDGDSYDTTTYMP